MQLIGSVRRECLNHVIILNERYLRRILSRYLDDYHCSCTHLSLVKDFPDTQPVSVGQGRSNFKQASFESPRNVYVSV